MPCSIRLLHSGWWRECAASGWQCRHRRGKAKSAGFLLLGITCGMGDDQASGPCRAGISVLPWVATQNAGKISLFTAGWRLSVAYAQALGTGDSAAEPDFWHYFFWVEHIQRFAPHDAHTAPSGTTCRSSLPVACRGWDHSPVHCTQAGKTASIPQPSIC